MRQILFFLFYFTIIYTLHGQTNSFNQPWLDSTKAIIIDAYAWNAINWDSLQKDTNVVAIIHKASEGKKIDPKYKERKIIAKQRGYKWGAYHLGKIGDPIEQADFYLDSINIEADDLMALDLEGLDTTKFMSLANAVKFIERVYEKTARYPLIYCNKNVLVEISEKYDTTSVFYKCGLWYARFRKDIPDFDCRMWKTYALWQFSCEINCKKTGSCLYNVAGTEYDMDVNIFNGSKELLLKKWPNLD